MSAERQILFDTGPGGGPVRFAAPIRLILAWTPEEVPAALADLAEAQRSGAWVAGYASYELGYLLMPKMRGDLPAGRDTPLLLFGLFDGPQPADLPAPVDAGLDAVLPGWSEAEYRPAFDRLHDYIGAGDIYQANLTFPLSTAATGDPLALYSALSARQPVAYGAFADLGAGPVILSRSPELFFETDAEGRITTLPMKGTAPRNADPVQDAAQRDWLAADPKNRAENLMIVDLLRNDLSRVARVGSVRVPQLYHVDSYATVHQMVSRVEAQLLPGIRLPDLLRALFPCGSVTGAPKRRAMQIIRELEPAPRGIYCGAIGWMGPEGQGRFNVAIRTLSLSGDGSARLNVGGGIVWDSRAGDEYEEALWKARFADL